MRKLNTTLLLFMAIITLCNCDGRKLEADYEVIPRPQEITVKTESPFLLNDSTLICYPQGNEKLQNNAAFLSEFVYELTGKRLKTQPAENEIPHNAFILSIDNSVNHAEGYKISVDAQTINISGKTEAGVFYGIQTIRKSMPISKETSEIIFPAAEINDYPRFDYRGMHLDVCRHFFSTDFVKRYIDILALHNINTFHWHLTDDQGWRIEIKKYPKLTEIGSVRKKTVIGKNTGEFDNTPYGGYYTQEEIKDVINYAAERYITIIPEIDLPGHMLAALAAYPHLGCTGGPYEVEPTWGIFADVICIGNENAMMFLEDVLDEVSNLFPSKYIHIGGDEAPRDNWKVCPKCQARIKKENLITDDKHTKEDRLQTYCTRRMESFLNKKGRQIIGWDEILDGDVAPNATIMSWRGLEGGIKAAQMGHDVIMVPTSHCYLDYYQTDNIEDEPFGIGGYVSVEKVYELEPVPDVLNTEEAKHILGAQANLWTEYIATPEHAEYMILPRLAALSEVQWSTPERKDYRNFTDRLPHLLNIYGQKGYNYATHVFDIKAKFTPEPEKGSVTVTMNTVDNADIYYTLDGSTPTSASSKYKNSLAINQNVQFNAVAIRAGVPGRKVSEEIHFNKATLKPITLITPPSKKYQFDGEVTLVDGLKGNESYSTGRWLGFIGGDVEAIIDLQQPTEIRKVSTQAIVDMSAWIMGSTGLVVSVSDDNESFREIAAKDYAIDTDPGKHSIDTYEVAFDPVKTRYVKIKIKRSKSLPKGHNGEGTAPYIFIDEICID